MYFLVYFPLQDTSYSEQWAEEAAKMYERPTSGPLKNHLLLNFAYADFLEVRMPLYVVTYVQTCFNS